MSYTPTEDTMWNDLVSIKNNPKAPKRIKEIAEMILEQLNTAGGKEMMGPLRMNWLIENKRYIVR